MRSEVTPRVRPWILIVAIAVIAAVPFLPAISGSWIYDDRPLIAENPYIRSFGWWTRWLTTDFWDVNEEIVRYGARLVYWRPAITASYAVDWQIGGGSPLMFHLTNSLMHAVVAALGYVVLKRWIGATWPALVAALLFALHPTKAESVAWIAGRTDVICMAAILVACEGMARRLRGQRFGIVLEVLGTAGAYLSKEQSIVLPVFAMVEVWVFAGRPAIDRSAVRKLIIGSLPQAVIAIGYLGVRAVVMPIESALGRSTLRLGDHVQVVLETFGRFAELTFAPHDLSVQQGLVHVVDGTPVLSAPHVVLGALALVLLSAAAIFARRRWPGLTVGLAFYFVTLLPTSNLRYTEMATLMSERFLYLPVMGLALGVGCALAQANREWTRRGYALAVACIVALSALSAGRSVDYTDEREFWAREKRLHPDSHEARMFELRAAQLDKRFQTALVLLMDINKLSENWDRSRKFDLTISYQVASILSRLVPDHEATTLRQIDQFCAEILEPTQPTARLAIGRVSIVLPLERSEYARWIKPFKARLLALRADLSARLGNDEQALQLALQARAVCARCQSVVVQDAIAHGRAGRYDEAFAVLDAASGYMSPRVVEGVREHLTKARAAYDAARRVSGPAQLQARASELAALELWGRAYDVLAPHKEAIQRAPRFAIGFAELAFRAGETAVAREVLAANVSSHEIEDKLAEWTQMMGWGE